MSGPLPGASWRSDRLPPLAASPGSARDPQPIGWTSPVSPDAVVSSGRRRWLRRTVRRVLDIGRDERPGPPSCFLAPTPSA
jgi:hypothetical protein